ncbi:MAG: glycosyltransferase family 39 protein [bacterium]|nr:glycosyltransferase family 39 protein [bacterium]
MIVLVSVVMLAYAVGSVHIMRNFSDIGSAHDGQYTNVSAHLVREGVYSLGARDAAGQLLPTATVPPLYTFLYAASYKMFGIGALANEPMRILQMLAAIGTLLVSWCIGRMFSARAGNIAATFAALDGTAFYFAQDYDIPDTLLGFFLALWLLFLVRFFREHASVRNIAMSTVFLGLAMWTKITPFLLWVPVAAMLAIFLWKSPQVSRRHAVQVAAVFATIIAVFFGGWTMRNVIVVGATSFASGATSLRWNAAHLVAYQQGISQPEARMQLAEQYFPPALVARGEGAVEREGGRAMARIILGSPVDFGIVTLRAMPGFFFGTFPSYLFAGAETARALEVRAAETHGMRALLPELWGDGRYGYVLAYVFAKAHLLFLYGVGLVGAGVLLRRPRDRWVLALCVLTVAYVVAVSGAAAQARYRTTILTIAYVLAGIGLSAAYTWMHTRMRQRAAA